MLNFISRIVSKNLRHKDSKTVLSNSLKRFLCAFAPLRKTFPALFLILLFSCGGDDSSNENVEYINVDSLYLIPEPILLEKREGWFEINSETGLSYSEDLLNEGDYLSKLIDSASNFELTKVLKSQAVNSEIELKLVNDFPAKLQHGEAYRLIISPEKLQITALTSTGIMRGIQTVRQLFIPAFHSGKKRQAWYLPCLKIEDRPTFEHRGLMLDVCRHFFEKEVIFEYLDLMAFYKMNVLHFHLTEDQGWRIQIDKYPLLNTISSYRKEKDGTIYGGFYTKEDLKEIVAYAKERHIVVIPEIELPGHAQAALAAYPEYSCNGGPIEVVNDWGVFKEIYCAGNDSTFKFLEDVLTEVMEIFPSEYIHIGGDEAPKFRWEHCAKCQQRMKDEGLKDEHELQSYFIQRIEKFLNSKGRKLIGWDEILEGGLSENASVQSWRGMDGGLAAAQQKHYVVMSPTSHCYIDYGLDAIDLKKVYSFNPIPENLKKEFHKYILGAEVNMWTEHVPDRANLDSKVFPRMIALAEMLWTGPDTNRYDDFYDRLQNHYPVLDLYNLKYGAEMEALTIEAQHNANDPFYVRIYPNLDDIDIEFRFNCDQCDTGFTEYKKGKQLNLYPGHSSVLEVKAYKNGKPYGDSYFQKIDHHKAVFSEATYKTPYNDWYTGGGEFGLVDGKSGSTNFRDGNWQGFWGSDLDVILDLGTETTISKITLNFLEYVNAWIMYPKSIRISYSPDNKTCFNVKNQKIVLATTNAVDGITITPYMISFDSFTARYIRIEAVNYGKMPPTHEAAGQDAWLFIDEIIIE